MNYTHVSRKGVTLILARFARPKHALRWLSRERHSHRMLCAACIRQSRNHPAGLRRNYTHSRLYGFPVCERHSTQQAADLLRVRIGSRPRD